jgi:hypothetical protein
LLSITNTPKKQQPPSHPQKKGEDFVVFLAKILLTPHQNEEEKNDLNARAVRFYPFIRPFYASSRAKTTHINENPNGELSYPRVFARMRFNGDWREERTDFWIPDMTSSPSPSLSLSHNESQGRTKN